MWKVDFQYRETISGEHLSFGEQIESFAASYPRPLLHRLIHARVLRHPLECHCTSERALCIAEYACVGAAADGRKIEIGRMRW